MSLRDQIEAQFEGKAFVRPLFYTYPGGLRFELSEGGSALEQFLTALRKAVQICKDVFSESSAVTVCLRVGVWKEESYFIHRTLLSELRAAGISIPSQRDLWLEVADPCHWLNVAFELPVSLIQNLLWCALASDFGKIRPNPGCWIYLFNLESGLMVWPYDDRGMDVVGSNHQKLSLLYRKYSSYLLDYDRAKMDEAFKTTNSPS